MSKKIKSNLKKYYLMFFGVVLIVFSYLFNLSFNKGVNIGTIVVKPSEKVKEEKAEQSQNLQEEGDKKPNIIEELSVNSTFSANSYLLYDVNSKQIVGGKDVDKKVANASTTKLMTALIAIESYPLNKVLTVPQECIGLEGNNVGFMAGETFYVEDLLYGLLLRSASDATCILTSAYPGGTPAFLEQMNKRAKEVGMENTNYINAIGLDAPDHYSSSHDLLKLILKVKEVEKLKIIMGSRDFTLHDFTYNKNYFVVNTNSLLFDLPGTVGYKTGFTSSAGECLVFGYNNFGTELIIVVMGSQNRFSDARHLLDLYIQKTRPEEGSVEATSTVGIPKEPPASQLPINKF